MIRTAILGASGHGGGELIRLIDAHPELDATYLGAHSKAGSRLGDVHPHLGGGDRVLQANDPDELPDVDVAFFALPRGTSAEPAMKMRAAGARVVDLGSDFRLDTAERYEAAYGSPHPHPEQLGRWVYGLPELFAAELAGAAPAALRCVVDNHVQVVGLAVGVLDHGVGDRFHEPAFLLHRASLPHLYDDERHRSPPSSCPPTSGTRCEIHFRRNGARPTIKLPPSKHKLYAIQRQGLTVDQAVAQAQSVGTLLLVA